MALSQTLLLRIFPKKQSMQAMGLWAMTTLLAPVVGPGAGRLAVRQLCLVVRLLHQRADGASLSALIAWVLLQAAITTAGQEAGR